MEIGEVQDLAFQQRDWRVQRVGWVVLLAFLSAALLGLFGPGPLSLSQAESTDQSITAQYYRFTRRGGPGTVTVRVSSEAIRDGSVALWWNNSYLSEMSVDGVTPEPDSVTTIGDRVRFQFAAEPSDKALDVTFDLTPDGLWSKHAEIAVADGVERLTYNQFIYP